MSWTDDPFLSSSDDGDSDDPFTDSEFPAPSRTAESEPSDPLRDRSVATPRRDPFVRDPFGGDSGSGTPADPFDGASAGGTPADPFGGDSGSGTPADPFDGSSGSGTPADPFDGGSGHGNNGEPFGSGSVGDGTPATRPTSSAGTLFRGSDTRPESTHPARRRLWLAAAVLTAAGAVAVVLASPWRDDSGARVAQPSRGADSGDNAQGSATPGPEPDSPATSTEGLAASQSTDDPASGVETTVSATVPGETSPASARGCDDQSGIDPHGLISFGPGLDRLSFCGEETWQVFVCTVRESDRTDRVAYIDEVLGEAAAWFDWVSGGQYDVDFSAGDDTSVASGGGAAVEECFEMIGATGWSESRSGAVVLLDEAALDPARNYAGIGTCGYISEADSGVFGDSERMVAIAVHAPGEQAAIAVHELGHAQCWPHSFSGKTESEYDNPLDVVSSDAWPVGTLAVNRYASGWIHPDQVRVHRGSTAEYDLSACCGGGVQMLALLPAGAADLDAGLRSRWWHLEVRDPEDPWERGLAEAGVGERSGLSVHWIDSSSGFDYERRQAQVGDETGTLGNVPVVFGSLRAAGAEFCLNSDIPTSFADCGADHEWRIEVAASRSGGLNVTVSPGA